MVCLITHITWHFVPFAFKICLTPQWTVPCFTLCWQSFITSNSRTVKQRSISVGLDWPGFVFDRYRIKTQCVSVSVAEEDFNTGPVSNCKNRLFHCEVQTNFTLDISTYILTQMDFTLMKSLEYISALVL